MSCLKDKPKPRKIKVQVVDKNGQIDWKGLPDEFKDKIGERFAPKQ